MKKYEGNKYKLKKNSIRKLRKKYNPTYHYLLFTILRYKKYQKEFLKVLSINNTEQIYDIILNTIESTAQELEIDKHKIYSYNSFNKVVKKKLKKLLKMERKNQIVINYNAIDLYKKMEKKEYKELRTIAFQKTNDFLEALYLYTISED